MILRVVAVSWLLVAEPWLAPAKLSDKPPVPPTATWCEPATGCFSSPCDLACRKWFRKYFWDETVAKHPRSYIWSA